MKITTKGRYAIRAVLYLALNEKDNKPISIKAITKQEKLSPIFLEQIFTKMKKAGVINSIRGAHGGFVLAKDIKDISVEEILVAVDEGLLLTPCSDGTGKNGDSCMMDYGCICASFWQDTNTMLTDYFKNISVADIIAKYSG